MPLYVDPCGCVAQQGERAGKAEVMAAEKMKEYEQKKTVAEQADAYKKVGVSEHPVLVLLPACVPALTTDSYRCILTEVCDMLLNALV